MLKLTQILTITLLGGLTACASAPEPLPAPVPVIVKAPAPVLTCAPVSSLQKVTVPAETKIQYVTTGIDNGEYADIESARIKRTIVVKPAQVFYVDSEGREVLDICEKDIPIGATGPGFGEVIPNDG